MGHDAAGARRQGWRAYAVDLRGHGESEWAPDGDYTLDAFAATSSRSRVRSTQPPALVGASLGGISSLAAIGEHRPTPLARALVLVDVAPRIEDAGRDRIGAFMARAHGDGFAVARRGRRRDPGLQPAPAAPDEPRGSEEEPAPADDGRWYWHWDPRVHHGRQGSPDETRSSLVDPDRLQAAARGSTIPTLLVRGRVSDLLSEEGAQELLELVPHAQLVDVAGAGHMVAGDRNDLFNDAVVAFLDEVRAGR